LGQWHSIKQVVSPLVFPGMFIKSRPETSVSAD